MFAIQCHARFTGTVSTQGDAQPATGRPEQGAQRHGKGHSESGPGQASSRGARGQTLATSTQMRAGIRLYGCYTGTGSKSFNGSLRTVTVAATGNAIKIAKIHKEPPQRFATKTTVHNPSQKGPSFLARCTGNWHGQAANSPGLSAIRHPARFQPVSAPRFFFK